jgi:L-alanine-DL-glutamate epimerase-like enolase superfamily enzyme
VLNPVRVACDGTVSAPQTPGLGLEIDWELLERTRVLEL